jgi:hypothetical protein
LPLLLLLLLLGESDQWLFWDTNPVL